MNPASQVAAQRIWLSDNVRRHRVLVVIGYSLSAAAGLLFASFEKSDPIFGPSLSLEREVWSIAKPLEILRDAPRYPRQVSKESFHVPIYFFGQTPSRHCP